MPERMMEVKTAALRLGVLPKTLRDWIRDGQLDGTAYRIGRRYLIPEKKFEEWIERHAVGSRQG